MTHEEFENLTLAVFDALPLKVHEKLKNVAVLVREAPTDEDKKEHGLREGETLLGLYKGIPLINRDTSYGIGVPIPDTIYIFMRPILDEAHESGVPVREVIHDTLLHEFAHYFGMDEEEVRRWEQEKK